MRKLVCLYVEVLYSTTNKVLPVKHIFFANVNKIKSSLIKRNFVWHIKLHNKGFSENKHDLCTCGKLIYI